MMKKNNARYIQIAFFVQPTVQWSEKVTLVACVQAVSCTEPSFKAGISSCFSICCGLKF